MEKIEEILRSVGADRLACGIRSWGETFCPYSEQELDSICFKRGIKESNTLRDQFKDFCQKYSSLDDSTRLILKDWAIKEFLFATWDSRDFGIRPKWTWKNFISKMETGSSCLDIGPCHGIHSNLVYKHYYKPDLKFFSADVQVPYLQLQKICGVDSRFFDASHMRLETVYEEESMDFILFTEVLEHLTRDEGKNLITSICNVLKPGGKMMISFPVDAKPFDFFTGVPFGHQYQPDIGEVSDQMKNLGIENQEYTKLWSGKTYQHVIVGKKQ